MNKQPILIAEDDADDRYLLQTAFSEVGYPEQIDFVENGIEVFSYLDKIYTGNNMEMKALPGFHPARSEYAQKRWAGGIERIKATSCF